MACREKGVFFGRVVRKVPVRKLLSGTIPASRLQTQGSHAPHRPNSFSFLHEYGHLKRRCSAWRFNSVTVSSSCVRSNAVYLYHGPPLPPQKWSLYGDFRTGCWAQPPSLSCPSCPTASGLFLSIHLTLPPSSFLPP